MNHAAFGFWRRVRCFLSYEEDNSRVKLSGWGRTIIPIPQISGVKTKI